FCIFAIGYMAKKVNIQARINAISKELVNGMVRSAIVSKYGQKWNITAKSIDKYITAARKQAQETQNLKEKAEAEALYETTKEAEKMRLLSLYQTKEILTKIALGEYELEKIIVIDG